MTRAPRLGRIGGFRPTPESLEKARRVAERMGLPFDLSATETMAPDLHAIYFTRVVEILGLRSEDMPDFTDGDFRRINAHVEPGEGRPEIRFDQQVDHWFMGVCHLVLISAAFPLDAATYGRLADHYTDFLDWRLDAYLLERRRDAHFEFFENYPDAWNLSHALSRSMTLFVLCHELAHVRLRHLDDPRPLRDLEFEADTTALDYFHQIVAQGPAAGEVCIDEKVSGAPLLVFRLFEAERRRHPDRIDPRIGGPDQHPKPMERLEHLRASMPPASEKAQEVTEGMLKAFDILDDKLAQRRSAERAEG